MKKIMLVVVLCTLYCQSYADIIIRGEMQDVVQAGGNTTFNCVGDEGICVVITTAANMAELMRGDEVIVRYSFESYRTEEVESGGVRSTRVTLVGTKPE